MLPSYEGRLSYSGFKGKNHKDVLLSEGGYTVKNIRPPQEKIQAYRLRHDVFCCELGWVPRTIDRLETDGYDKHSVSFGVFDGSGAIKAYLRLILTQLPFMLENEFACLTSPAHRLRKLSDTAEISRLCVARDARKDSVSGNFGLHNISLFLYKGVYHWCVRNSVRYLYLVVESKILRLLRARGFPCMQIGENVRMPDDVDAVAAFMDWRDFEETNMKNRPKMMGWFNLYRPARYPVRQPLHESGLRHRVSP